jgi:enoyl-CoA hydratase/carnithine racemase
MPAFYYYYSVYIHTGLVSKVLAPDKLVEHALELAKKISSMSRPSGILNDTLVYTYSKTYYWKHTNRMFIDATAHL